jgi:hypothetical protein
MPLIPRKVLFGNPDRSQVRISPDGATLSWLAPRDGVLNVWVAPRQNLEAARPVTHDTGHGFARPENNLSFNAIAEAFLAKVLGGRHEVVGDDFKGASLQVLVGAADVPGLPEALTGGG